MLPYMCFRTTQPIGFTLHHSTLGTFENLVSTQALRILYILPTNQNNRHPDLLIYPYRKTLYTLLQHARTFAKESFIEFSITITNQRRKTRMQKNTMSHQLWSVFQFFSKVGLSCDIWELSCPF